MLRINEFIIALLSLICLFLVYIAHQVTKLGENAYHNDILLPPDLMVADEHVETSDEHVQHETHIHTFSDEHIEKQRTFDERIRRIKSELAEKQNDTRTGYIAEELHDDVKNLPHNTINEYQGIQDVEYAD